MATKLCLILSGAIFPSLRFSISSGLRIPC
jgi:hypothetical protein